MRIRDFIWCGGRLTRGPYWSALIALGVVFLSSAIAFPLFILIIVPCLYLAFCWLANRLRDATWPAALALIPVFLFFGLVIYAFVHSILPREVKASAVSLATISPWAIGVIYLTVGLLPSSRQSEGGK
jgi:amino acid transporter